jgi:ribosomal protein S18 acetylase RimI-like enzyme
MTITIKKADLDDQKSVFVLAQHLATSFIPNKRDFAASFKNVLNQMSSGHSFLLVAKKNELTVGYILGFVHSSFYANGNISFIEELYVDDNYRKQGVGALLMTAAEKFAYQQQAKLMSVSTRRAGDFYQRCGYEESAVYYRKLLNAEHP